MNRGLLQCARRSIACGDHASSRRSLSAHTAIASHTSHPRVTITRRRHDIDTTYVMHAGGVMHARCWVVWCAHSGRCHESTLTSPINSLCVATHLITSSYHCACIPCAIHHMQTLAEHHSLESKCDRHPHSCRCAERWLITTCRTVSFTLTQHRLVAPPSTYTRSSPTPYVWRPITGDTHTCVQWASRWCECETHGCSSRASHPITLSHLSCSRTSSSHRARRTTRMQ